MSTLKELMCADGNPLRDCDGVEELLARSLGLGGDTTKPWLGEKGIFWSNNPIGNALSTIVEQLEQMRALLKFDDERFRWNENFEFRWIPGPALVLAQLREIAEQLSIDGLTDYSARIRKAIGEGK